MSSGSEHMSLTQEELGDEVSWAEDVQDVPNMAPSGTALDEGCQLSIYATQSLKLQQSAGLKKL